MSIIESLWTARRISRPRQSIVVHRPTSGPGEAPDLGHLSLGASARSSHISQPRSRTKFQIGQSHVRIEEDGDEEDENESTKAEDESALSIAVQPRTLSQIRAERKKRRAVRGKGEKFYPILIHNQVHRLVFDFVESKGFSGFIMAIILMNTAMLIAQTWMVLQVRGTWYFAVIDNIFMGIYIMEIVLKTYAWRSHFFYEGWNILDLTIVIFNVIDFALPLIIQNMGGFNGAAIFRLLRIFRAIRALRALRVLRTIRFLANLQVIMTTILQSIKSIGAIVMLISLFMYMFAVIGRGLYAEVYPSGFGNLFYAFFTLFQLLTLDDWFIIYTTATAADPSSWHIIFYLLLYIVVEYFIFLNLFVAVLVDNFHLTLEAQNAANEAKKSNLDDSDEEEEVFAMSVSSEDSDVTEFSDEVKTRKNMDDYYHDMSPDDKENLRNYFQLLASLEYNNHVLTNQQRILNMMVDLCVETNDDV